VRDEVAAGEVGYGRWKNNLLGGAAELKQRTAAIRNDCGSSIYFRSIVSFFMLYFICRTASGRGTERSYIMMPYICDVLSLYIRKC